jgi:hypothetical protein
MATQNSAYLRLIWQGAFQLELAEEMRQTPAEGQGAEADQKRSIGHMRVIREEHKLGTLILRFENF